MKQVILALCVSLIAVILQTGSSFAEETLPTVDFEDIVYNGSGCPVSTASVNISHDSQGLAIHFDEFFAYTAPGSTFADSRKNCQLTLDYRVSEGYQFALESLDIYGWMYLEEGVNYRLSSRHYFQGSPGTIRGTVKTSGYYNDDFLYRQVFSIDSLNWSPCGVKRALNINFSQFVRADDGEGIGFASIEKIDNLKLVFRKCAP